MDNASSGCLRSRDSQPRSCFSEPPSPLVYFWNLRGPCHGETRHPVFCTHTLGWVSQAPPGGCRVFPVTPGCGLRTKEPAVAQAWPVERPQAQGLSIKDPTLQKAVPQAPHHRITSHSVWKDETIRARLNECLTALPDPGCNQSGRLESGFLLDLPARLLEALDVGLKVGPQDTRPGLPAWDRRLRQQAPRPLPRLAALLTCPSHGKRKGKLPGNPKHTLSFRVPPALPSPTRGAAQRRASLLHLEAAVDPVCILYNCPLTPAPAHNCG